MATPLGELLQALSKKSRRLYDDASKKGLDVSESGRDARWRDQGYSEDTVYHSTAEDFDAFDPDRAIGTQYWSTTDRQAVEAGDVGAEGSGVIKEMRHRIKNPAGWDEYDKYGIDELKAQGYDGVALPEDGNTTYIAFEPDQYRDIRAVFDPENIGSGKLMGNADPRLLAAIAAGGTGLLAGGKLLQGPGETDIIKAPNHPNVLKLANALSKVNRSVEGSPFELFAPEATAEWLRKLSYGQKPTMMDRVGVVGDFL